MHTGCPTDGISHPLRAAGLDTVHSSHDIISALQSVGVITVIWVRRPQPRGVRPWGWQASGLDLEPMFRAHPGSEVFGKSRVPGRRPALSSTGEAEGLVQQWLSWDGGQSTAHGSRADSFLIL